MKNLLWLASYPKSGNTWMRVFLANIQCKEETSVDINALGDYWANQKNLFNLYSSLESTLLTDVETLEVRHHIYESMNATMEKLTFLKTHATYWQNLEVTRVFSAQPSRGAIYLIRNPLDLVASLANHNSSTFDEAISVMSDETYTLFANRQGKPSNSLLEPVSSWDRNVTSWADECEFPLLVIRYEDMIFQPFETFSRAASFAGLSEDPYQIKRAIEYSSFENLRKQEEEKGFQERPKKMEKFFRKGKVGSWPEELSPAQAEWIIHDHGAVMRRFGYLTEDGTPVY